MGYLNQLRFGGAGVDSDTLAAGGKKLIWGTLFTVEAVFVGLYIGFLMFGLIGGILGCFQNGGLVEAAQGAFGVNGGNNCALGFTAMSLSVSGWFLGMSAILFDWIMQVFVVSMAPLIGKGSGIGESIKIVWTIIRDIGNLAFIAGLVYSAVAMILQVNNSRVGERVIKILVAALLINFSYFFGAVIIDASNFVSKQIYQEAIYGGKQINPFDLKNLELSPGSLETAPITSRFMVITRLGSIEDFKNIDIKPGQAPTILIGGLGTAMFALTAATFLTAAIFLLIRFVIIIILLITSPLAVLNFTGLPGLSTWGAQWWKTLQAQALFPVIFLFLIATSFKVLESGLILKNVPLGERTLSSIFKSGTGTGATLYAWADLFVLFLIAQIFIIFALKAASSIAQEANVAPPSPTQLFAFADKATGMAKRFVTPVGLATTLLPAAGKAVFPLIKEGLRPGFSDVDVESFTERVDKQRIKDVKRSIADTASGRSAPTDTDRKKWDSLSKEKQAEIYQKSSRQERKVIDDHFLVSGKSAPPKPKDEVADKATEKPAPQSGGDQTKKSASGGSNNTTRASASASFTAIDQRLASFEQSLREGNRSLERSMEDLTDIERKDLFQEAMLQRTEIFADRDNARKIAEAIGGDRFNETVAEFPANKFSAQIADAIAPHLDEIGYSLLRTRKDFTPDQHKTLDDSMARNNSGVMASARAIRPDIR